MDSSPNIYITIDSGEEKKKGKAQLTYIQGSGINELLLDRCKSMVHTNLSTQK